MDNVYYSGSVELQEQENVISRSLTPGTLIDDKYEITSVLDEGGMGTIYSAIQKGLNRRVIIKTLQISKSTQEGAILRFERESKLLGSLQHEHLVQVYSSGIISNQLPYIAMEFIDGRTLSIEIKKTGRLTWERACKIGKQICKAMDYAHSHGVVHRDLKPANILLLESPEPDFVKVIDFGLGAFLEGSGQQTITETGALIGSPEYMSPETCSGLKPDFRSDVYSMGCLLFEAVTGLPPFVSDNPIGLLYRHKNELPAKPSRFINETVPDSLDAVILKALEKSPDRRYQSMDEFASALEALLQNRTLGFDLKQISAERSAKEKAQSSGLLSPTAIMALLLIIAVVTFPLFLKARDLATKSNKNMAKDQIAIEMLQQISQLKQSALLEQKQGTRKRAVELAEKSMRQMLRELVSARDSKQTNKQELATIQGFREIGSLLMKPEGQKQLEALDKARDLERHSSNYHNVAMLSLLAANIFGGASNQYSSINNYCQAIEALSKAKEFELAELTAQTALDEIQSNQQDNPNFLKSKIELSRATVFLEQGNITQALDIADKEQKRFPQDQLELLAVLYLQTAEIYEQAGVTEQAEKSYKLASKYTSIRQGDFPEIWKGLARIYEKQKKLSDALEAYSQLRKHATNHSDFPNIDWAGENIERVRSQINKDESALK